MVFISRLVISCIHVLLLVITAVHSFSVLRTTSTRLQHHTNGLSSIQSTIHSRARRQSSHRMVSSTTPESLMPWEEYLIGEMAVWYDKALLLKCPFMRRRAADLLDGFDHVLRYYLVQNPSLMGPPLAYRCVGDTCTKQFGLSLEELAEQIRKDWREDTRKGYYITGKVNTSIYRDDCMFNGPDPDMPVRGLRKYLNAASQLFDPSKSVSELLSLTVENNVVVATWRMNGRLRLPWKPWMPEVTGKTTYYTDMNGLICLHDEEWDISVFRAFLQTLWPEAGQLIWDYSEVFEKVMYVVKRKPIIQHVRWDEFIVDLRTKSLAFGLSVINEQFFHEHHGSA